jgi:hypothetical protein
MAEFCEYMGGASGVCMRPQSTHRLEGDLLRYCDAHFALVQREQMARRRTIGMPLEAEFGTRRGANYRHLHAHRAHSEPYLGRSTIQWPRDRTGRVAVLVDDRNGRLFGKNSWSRVASATARLMEEPTPIAAIKSLQDMSSFESKFSSWLDVKPASTQVAQKRVRVTKRVLPRRFEVLDDGHDFADHEDANVDECAVEPSSGPVVLGTTRPAPSFYC